jgi:hypothetical protein
MNHAAEIGISRVLIERLQRDRLPRILEIKEHVDAGRALDDNQLGFLQKMLQDAQENASLVDSLPDCRELFARVIHLCHDITATALQNEDGSQALAAPSE